MLIFRLLQIRLQRYSPMPVAFLSLLPLYPVKPFSKIRGRSSFAIPMPVSSMQRIFFGLIYILTAPFSVYFSALESSCSMTKDSHFSSVTILMLVGVYSSRILLPINSLENFLTQDFIIESRSCSLNNLCCLNRVLKMQAPFRRTALF